MGVRLLLSVAILLVAFAAAMAVSHVIRWPLRPEASALPIVRLQSAVRRFGLLLGVIEVAALIALLVLLFKVQAGTTMWLVVAAALCVAAMMGVWAAWLRPLNATIAAWLPETRPKDWSHHHRRWATLHSARAILAIIALALLLMALTARSAH
jgi:uncharacterized membrane protein